MEASKKFQKSVWLDEEGAKLLNKATSKYLKDNELVRNIHSGEIIKVALKKYIGESK